MTENNDNTTDESDTEEEAENTTENNQQRQHPVGRLLTDLFNEADRLTEEINKRNEQRQKERGCSRPHVGFGHGFSFNHINTETVFDEDEEEITLYVDMPGVTAEDIDIQSTTETIKISAETETRNYNVTRQLPIRVNPETSTAEYQNGVLQVTLDVEEETRTEINVE